jgi:hypothetical protein
MLLGNHSLVQIAQKNAVLIAVNKSIRKHQLKKQERVESPMTAMKK